MSEHDQLVLDAEQRVTPAMLWAGVLGWRKAMRGGPDVRFEDGLRHAFAEMLLQMQGE